MRFQTKKCLTIKPQRHIPNLWKSPLYATQPKEGNDMLIWLFPLESLQSPGNVNRIIKATASFVNPWSKEFLTYCALNIVSSRLMRLHLQHIIGFMRVFVETGQIWAEASDRFLLMWLQPWMTESAARALVRSLLSLLIYSKFLFVSTQSASHCSVPFFGHKFWITVSHGFY